MVIENISNDKITITLSSSVDKFGFQRLMEYLEYLEATANSTAKQSEIDQLANEVNAEWWKKNKSRFIK
jgi:hypothetical protein